MKRIAGWGLILLCAVVDRIPWRDHGKWYWIGQRGCVWGLASKGFEMMEGKP